MLEKNLELTAWCVPNVIDEVVQVYKNPAYVDVLRYHHSPQFAMQGNLRVREFEGMETTLTWEIVDNLLPRGARWCPLVFMSDEAVVTSDLGGKKMHALYITLGGLPLEHRKLYESMFVAMYSPIWDPPKGRCVYNGETSAHRMV